MILPVLGAAGFLTLLSYFAALRVMKGNGRKPLTVRPEGLGLSSEPVSCRTADGLTLRGWFIPAKEPSARTVLLCHGYGTNKGAILEAVAGLTARGFNLLAFDFRCCGESEGDLLSVGHLEARDFDAAVAFMKTLRPNDAYFAYGLSMGAMVTFVGLTRHREFKAAALESPFFSHDVAVIRYMRHNSGVPYFPLVPLVLFWMSVRLGENPNPKSPCGVAKDFNVPLLAICGSEDRICPPEVAESLLALVPGPKEHWVVQGAGHGRCGKTAGAEYAERLAKHFLSA